MAEADLARPYAPLRMAAATDVLSRPWPLTGRHEDLEAVCDAVAEGCPAYAIVGAPGTGKTRLAREVLRRLEGDGWPVAGATATETARATPLGALAHLVPSGAFDVAGHALPGHPRRHRRAVGRPAPRAARRRCPPPRPQLGGAAGQPGRGRRGAAGADDAVRGPRARGDRRPPRHRRRPVADPPGRSSPPPSTRCCTGCWAGPLDGVAEAQLLETSGGNPLYLRELVLARRAGRDARRGGRGVAPHRAAPGHRRARRPGARPHVHLSGDGARRAGAHRRRRADRARPARDHGRRGACSRTWRTRALIRVDQDQRRNEVRLAHPVYGEILRSSLGRVRLPAALAAARRGDRCNAGARRRDDAVRIVRWQIDAGITPDIEVVLAGARLARHHQDWARPCASAGAALDAGHADAVGAARRGALRAGRVRRR